MTLHLSSRGRWTVREWARPGSIIKRVSLAFMMALVMLLSTACAVDERQSGIPLKAQEAIDTFTRDFADGRFDKIYAEAAQEWRDRVTPEQSDQTFRTIKEKLGDVRERTFTSGRQQQKPSGGPPEISLVIRYNTSFERADGMESFTLVERDERYLLAGYSVSSNVLGQ